MQITSLAVHPVKSTAIRPLPTVAVLPRGFADDRSWVVVDTDGVVVTAREQHDLFTIVADTPRTDPALDRDLRLRAADLPDLLLDHPDADLVRVKLFSQADWTDFHENLKNQKPKGGRPRKQRGRESA